MNGIKSIYHSVTKLMYILNRQQKMYGVLVIIISFIGAILETLGVSLIIPLINALLTPEVLMDNKWVIILMDLFQVETSTSMVLMIGLFTIFLYVFKNAFFIIYCWIKTKYALKVQRELSIHMMKTYMGKGYSFFLNMNTSELMRGVFADTNGVYAFLNQLFKLIIEFLTVFLICIFIMKTDWILAISVVILAVICFVFIYGFFKTKMKKSGEQHRKYGAIVNQNAIQAFQGIKEVIVMRKQKFFVNNFEKACIEQQKAGVIHTVGTEIPAYLIEAICITGLLGIIVVRIALGQEDASSMLPTLSAFAVGAFRILPALGKISAGVNTMLFYIPSLNDMYTHLKKANENKDTIDKLYDDSGMIEKQSVKLEEGLVISDVHWKYEGGKDEVLRGIDINIKKGSSVAFIGQSGAGKTTLADIVLGLLKPENGRVLIDGKDIFSIGDNWSRIIGYVPQNVYLTDDSIRKNIAFGIDEKNIDDSKVWKALEQAHLKEFVMGLDKGLDTPVGERGVRFSGGQRQRVAIARALYENPDILVLDEATAALDNETEKAVMESIEELQGHKTLIIIAHRITTIRNCDDIYEIKDGKAVHRIYSDIVKEA